jgi:hypothetical protein
MTKELESPSLQAACGLTLGPASDCQKVCHPRTYVSRNDTRRSLIPGKHQKIDSLQELFVRDCLARKSLFVVLKILGNFLP